MTTSPDQAAGTGREDTGMPDEQITDWKRFFNEREQRLIRNCLDYSRNDPAGLPGHNIMLIVATMTKLLDATGGYFAWQPSDTDEGAT